MIDCLFGGKESRTQEIKKINLNIPIAAVRSVRLTRKDGWFKKHSNMEHEMKKMVLLTSECASTQKWQHW
ncbi:hypothetical protein SLEP1_g58583 [Rubroshorea leprosula]|uniref:Uncharacterized protein n=1 Tax=Rubroshorea leprosula TaxID=152421 RepID=A0AAV5MUB4_9ROSI|nr:hypothetical protein SLEP1_g58583 [Rubroshorea leprosula]